MCEVALGVPSLGYSSTSAKCGCLRQQIFTEVPSFTYRECTCQELETTGSRQGSRVMMLVRRLLQLICFLCQDYIWQFFTNYIFNVILFLWKRWRRKKTPQKTNLLAIMALSHFTDFSTVHSNFCVWWVVCSILCTTTVMTSAMLGHWGLQQWDMVLRLLCDLLHHYCV